MASKYLTIKISRDEALSHGLLACSCGHWPNNHFDYHPKAKGACAFCQCDKYDEVVVVGKLVKRMAKTYEDGLGSFDDGYRAGIEAAARVCDEWRSDTVADAPRALRQVENRILDLKPQET